MAAWRSGPVRPHGWSSSTTAVGLLEQPPAIRGTDSFRRFSLSARGGAPTGRCGSAAGLPPSSGRSQEQFEASGVVVLRGCCFRRRSPASVTARPPPRRLQKSSHWPTLRASGSSSSTWELEATRCLRDESWAIGIAAPCDLVQLGEHAKWRRTRALLESSAERANGIRASKESPGTESAPRPAPRAQHDPVQPCLWTWLPRTEVDHLAP